MRFLAPGRLWLLLAVVGLTLAYVVLQRRRRHYAVRFTNLELLAAVAPRRPGWRRHVATGALLAALAALTVGFAKPTRAVKVPRQEATVMLVIDTSASMRAVDVPPSRVAAAKQAAATFASRLPRRFRLGLVTFDAAARVVMPPTVDHAAVTDAIDRIRLGSSTAGGEALYTALDSIAGSTSASSKKKPPARIVFMSDGATTTGRPLAQAARAARAANVPVSTIAFGTDNGVVTIRDRTVPVPVDRDSLAQVARLSGGKAFEASSGEELTSVYRDIGSSIGHTTQRREATALFTGLGLLLAGVGVTAGLVWGGRLL